MFKDDTYFTSTAALITVNRWRAECIGSSGLRVFSPDGTNYEMTQLGHGPSGVNAWYTTKITDRNGNTITIAYQTLGTRTVPSSISTSDGRSVTFTYTSNTLSTISDGTRTWTYGYTLPTNAPGWLLTSVSLPSNGGTWAYAYNTTVPVGGAGQYSMKQVTYPQGGSIDYTYSTKLFSLNVPQNTVVATKSTSDGGNWTFSYTPSSGGIYDTTVVTTPTGQITYKHYGAGGAVSGTYDLVNF